MILIRVSCFRLVKIDSGVLLQFLEILYFVRLLIGENVSMYSIFIIIHTTNVTGGTLCY